MSIAKPTAIAQADAVGVQITRYAPASTNEPATKEAAKEVADDETTKAAEEATEGEANKDGVGVDRVVIDVVGHDWVGRVGDGRNGLGGEDGKATTTHSSSRREFWKMICYFFAVLRVDFLYPGFGTQ